MTTHTDAEPQAQCSRVVSFDLDGTLLRGTTVSEFLARRLGHEDLLHDLEAQYAAGLISNAAVAEATADAFVGVSLTDVAHHLDAAPWMNHINDVVAALRARGCRVLLCTVTWRFAADYLGGRCGFDAVSGTVMGARDGVLTGTLLRHFALNATPDARAAAGEVIDTDDLRDLLPQLCAAHSAIPGGRDAEGAA